MSLEAIGAPASEPTIFMDVNPPVVVVAVADSSKPLGLNSPPDSNNAMTLDGSDSELSDIDEVADKLDGKLELNDAIQDEIRLETEPAPAPANETQQNEPEAQPGPAVEEAEDIGEVLPDHWSGTVPVFKPTMRQFQDFKVFVRLAPPSPNPALWPVTNSEVLDDQSRQVRHEVWNH